MTQPAGEQFRLKLTGGPCEGEILTSPDGYGWPLPDELPIPHLVESEAGTYRKVSEFNGGTRAARGARYVWEERHGCQ